MKILVLLLLVSCNQPKTCNKVKIVEVGTCNKSGNCITKLSNGEYEHFDFPMVGMEVCP